MPLANPRVIPDDWSAHHQPTAAGQMLSECVITRPTGAGATFDEATAVTTTPDPELVYEGPCREQLLNRAQVGATPSADRDVTVRQWRVCIDVRIAGGSDVQVNDLVEVTGSPDDPSRAGVRLQVVDVGGGTLVWQRDLICVDYAATSR